MGLPIATLSHGGNVHDLARQRVIATDLVAYAAMAEEEHRRNPFLSR